MPKKGAKGTSPDYEKNKARRERLLAQGLCPIHCTQPLAPGLLYCLKCSDNSKNHQKTAKYLNKCPAHPDRQPAPGKTICAECLEGRKQYRFLSKYGVTKEWKQQRLEAQQYCCAICAGDIAQYAAVDHDHQTGFVRGLLCRNCNSGLGMFQDSFVALDCAKRYLAGAADNYRAQTYGVDE